MLVDSCPLVTECENYFYQNWKRKKEEANPTGTSLKSNAPYHGAHWQNWILLVTPVKKDSTIAMLVTREGARLLYNKVQF